MTTEISPRVAPQAQTADSEPTHPRASRFDQRGIALQTVIIIVVMLAIAGTVAGVLFSRANQVTSELRDADTTPALLDTVEECRSRKPFNDTTVDVATANTCKWTGTATNQITPSQCNLEQATGLTVTHSTSNNGECTIVWT